jgi:hypothetical protein
MPQSITPQEFVAKWKESALTEQASAQSHFNDLCALLGQPNPVEADPAGTSYTFERGAEKATGGQGWADVWKRGYFGWEYKGPHRDLARAYQQLQLYREALENPPLLIVSDTLTIEVHTNFTNTVKQKITFNLDDLLDPQKLDLLRCVFTNPAAFRGEMPTEEVTAEAARRFAAIADRLRGRGVEPQRAAHFLIRLLFCLFSEDVGLLPEGLFARLVEGGRRRPELFASQLRALFGAMAQGTFFGPDTILCFDGGLFNDDEVIELDMDELGILWQASKLDWGAIEPAILGTLFVRSLDPAQRSQLGGQFTGKADILLIEEPVLMAPLRRRWAQVKAQALALAKRRDAATGGQRTKLGTELDKLLRGFMVELASIRCLDPAMGAPRGADWIIPERITERRIATSRVGSIPQCC